MNEIPASAYTMPLGAATDCLKFSEKMLAQQDNIPEELEVSEEFKEELENFTNFMKLSVNSKFENITIPDRHKRIFDSLIQAFTLYMIFGE